jgi:hypothetical protein
VKDPEFLDLLSELKEMFGIKQASAEELRERIVLAKEMETYTADMLVETIKKCIELEKQNTRRFNIAELLLKGKYLGKDAGDMLQHLHEALADLERNESLKNVH